MSDDLPDRTEAELARRRAAIAFGGLAAAAVIAVVLVFTLSRPGSSTKQASQTGVTAQSQPAAPRTTPKPTPRATTSAAKPKPTVSKPAATSCTPAPCVLAGDPGIVAAVNVLRKSQGQPVVTAVANGAASSCALHSGDGCPGSYYWAHVSSTQGTAIVTKISQLGGGRAWLLNPKLTKLAVGCAQPVTGQFQCAVLDQSAA